VRYALEQANLFMDDTKSQYAKPDPESATVHERPHSFSDTEAFLLI
jgi:hypothetical protein